MELIYLTWFVWFNLQTIQKLAQYILMNCRMLILIPLITHYVRGGSSISYAFPLDR